MNTATKEAVIAPDYYMHRHSELEEPPADVVAWAGLLDKIVEHDLSRYPQMSKRELFRLAEEFEHVNDALKDAVDRLDNLYHERETEEEAGQ
jgi:hypothetical protein